MGEASLIKSININHSYLQFCTATIKTTVNSMVMFVLELSITIFKNINTKYTV